MEDSRWFSLWGGGKWFSMRENVLSALKEAIVHPLLKRSSLDFEHDIVLGQLRIRSGRNCMA